MVTASVTMAMFYVHACVCVCSSSSGEGQFGKVYECFNMDRAEINAVKVVSHAYLNGGCSARRQE